MGVELGLACEVDATTVPECRNTVSDSLCGILPEVAVGGLIEDMDVFIRGACDTFRDAAEGAARLTGCEP